MKSTKIQNVKKAVKWWARQFTPQGDPSDNGDDSELGPLGFGLMNLNVDRARQKTTDIDLALFEEVLEKKLMDELRENDEVILDVDYHPDWLLKHAVEASGLDAGCLPCKTTMWVRRDKVVVSCGYRAPRKEL